MKGRKKERIRDGNTFMAHWQVGEDIFSLTQQPFFFLSQGSQKRGEYEDNE